MSKKATTRAEALRLARRIGCNGAHQNDDGQWMPCASHDELTQISSAAEEKSDEPPCIGCDGKAERKRRGKNQKKRWERLRERGVMGIDTLDGGGLVSGGKSEVINVRPERVRLYDPYKAKYGLYEKALNERQQAIYDDLEKVVEEHGMFDWGTGPNGAHYVSADKNPFIKDGLVCSNCSFWKGPNKCELVKGELEPNAICKLWVIDGDRIDEKGKKSAFDVILEKGIGGPIGRRGIRVEPFDPKAEDGDGDGKLQDGTTAERPAAPVAQVVEAATDITNATGVGADWRKPVSKMTRKEISDQMRQIDELFNSWPPPSKRRAEFLTSRYEELFETGLRRGLDMDLEMSGGGKKKNKNRNQPSGTLNKNWRQRFIGGTAASRNPRTGSSVFTNPIERIMAGRWHWQIENELDAMPPVERNKITASASKLDDWVQKMRAKLGRNVAKVDTAEVTDHIRQQRQNALMRRGINEIKDIAQARDLLRADFPNLNVDAIPFETVNVNGVKTDDLTKASAGKVLAFLVFADTLDADDPIRNKIIDFTLDRPATLLGGTAGTSPVMSPFVKGLNYRITAEAKGLATGQDLLDFTRPNNPYKFTPEFNRALYTIRELELARRAGTVDITEDEIVELANMAVISHELGHIRHMEAWFAPWNWPDNQNLQQFLNVSDAELNYYAGLIAANSRAMLQAIADQQKNYKRQTGQDIGQFSGTALSAIIAELGAGRPIPPDDLKDIMLQLMMYAKHGDIMDGKNWADDLSDGEVNALKIGMARISVYAGESYGMFSDSQALPEIFAELETFKILTGRMPDEREGLTPEQIEAIQKADDWYNRRGSVK